MLKKIDILVNHGVKVKTPLPDPEMASELRKYRVHLYPSNPNEVNALTLAESQAVGVPAVARPLGSVAEKITNGVTGYLTSHEEQYSNYVNRLLDDDELFFRMSKASRESKRLKSWDIVSEEFEGLIR